MPTPHKYAAIIKAWADGETIQWRRDWGRWPTDWQDCYDNKPDFNCQTLIYRVKPKLKDPGQVVRAAWYGDNNALSGPHHRDDKKRWEEAASEVIRAYKAGELDESKLV